MRSLYFTASLACLGLLGTVGVHAAPAVSAADRAFVAMVSQGGMFEVEAGKAGAAQGGTQDIRDQGSTETHDHELVGQKLRSIATSIGLAFPDHLNATFQAELDALKAKSGEAFDAAYLHDMAVIHAKDGAAFEREAERGTNPDLRRFAAETHRIVLRHIGEIKAIGPARPDND